MRARFVTTDAFGAFIVPYRCVHCGFTAQAKIHAYAESSQAYYFDSDAAANRAQAKATDGAADKAVAGVALATCPKCGRYDEKAAGHKRLVRVIVVILVGLVAGAIAGWYFAHWW